MIPTIDDIEKAKKWMKPLWPENCPKDHAASIVRFCMDFTAKAMGEPSEEALSIADSVIPRAEPDYDGWNRMMGREIALECFKAMAKQIAKECE